MNIVKIADEGEDFRLLQTTQRTQTATITLKPGERTSDGFNFHPKSDQTVVILEGEMLAEVGGERAVLRLGESLIIPAGAKHRLRNESTKTVFAFTLYAPPAYDVDVAD